jgi:hypothetical protein
MKNVSLILQNSDYRIGFLADDVKGVRMERVNIPACNALPAVLLNNVKEHSLKSLKLPGDIKSALRIQ